MHIRGVDTNPIVSFVCLVWLLAHWIKCSLRSWCDRTWILEFNEIQCRNRNFVWASRFASNFIRVQTIFNDIGLVTLVRRVCESHVFYIIQSFAKLASKIYLLCADEMSKFVGTCDVCTRLNLMFSYAAMRMPHRCDAQKKKPHESNANAFCIGLWACLRAYEFIGKILYGNSRWRKEWENK